LAKPTMRRAPPAMRRNLRALVRRQPTRMSECPKVQTLELRRVDREERINRVGNHLQAEEIKGRSELGKSGFLGRVEFERDEEEDKRDPASREVDICEESVGALAICRFNSQKHQRQVARWVSRPPRIGPSTAATPHAEPRMP
jgi:hypothetical protein